VITVVDSATSLTSALKAAHAGDTIQLASGTYASFDLRGAFFAQGVTITSQDPNAKAVLTGFDITKSTGLTFANLEFSVNPNGADNPFKVSDSNEIHFANLNVHGSMDGNPQNDQQAFIIRSSTNISVERSEFQQVEIGINQLDNNALVIKDNVFHDLRMDGIRGGGSSNVLVTGNTFHDFYPLASDHGDAIQFWTTNTTASVHDITVTNNTVMRGAGGLFQGVFFRDEVGGLPFINVKIAGNLVEGGNYNGITVDGGVNVDIEHNIVQGFTDTKNWIRLDNVDGATLTSNSTNYLMLSSTTDSHITQTGTKIVPLAADGGAAGMLQWRIEHGLAIAPPVVAEVITPGVTVTGTAGADSLAGGAGGDTLVGGGGSDTLAGGAGDDLYVSVSRPTVIEGDDGGVDTVRTGDSYTLPSNVENLELTSVGGSYGQGNELDNAITGGAGGDHLFGRDGSDTVSGGGGADVINGGTGSDILTGGAGADTFVFAKGDGQDEITDFGAGGEHDTIDASALLNAGVTASLTESSVGVTITFTSGDAIQVDGVHLADLHATASGWVF
jgi:Ca2+-binding RTX toxin-like protein